MLVKKLLRGIIIFLAMMIFVTSQGPLTVIAQAVGGAQPMETASTIEIELNDHYFHPKDISIPNGETTTFVLKNNGNKKHTFTVKELGIDAEVQAGNEKTITVNPKKSGTYELICRFHLQQGMVGKVIVN